MIWFTSDLHLGHLAAINMCGRPFESIEEMNDRLIENFNKYVKKNDTVYILGDLAFRIPVKEAEELIGRLNGKKILLKGNHDKKYNPDLFAGIYDFLEINVSGINISLMHYPMMEWPKSRHGSLHLHGHIHSNIERNEGMSIACTSDYNLEQRDREILRYDVGVDANEYRPVSIDEILEFFDLKEG